MNGYRGSALRHRVRASRGEQKVSEAASHLTLTPLHPDGASSYSRNTYKMSKRMRGRVVRGSRRCWMSLVVVSDSHNSRTWQCGPIRSSRTREAERPPTHDDPSLTFEHESGPFHGVWLFF